MISKSWLFNLQDALAFFTRLVKPHDPKSLDFFTKLSLLPLVGLILGLIIAGATYILHIILANSSIHPLVSSFLCAWLWLALEIYLTRALHWDGVADLGDALGSGHLGPKFWEILHDSRLGSFGAIALSLTLLGQLLAIAAHISHNNWHIIFAAPLWARLAPLWLAKNLAPHPSSKLATSLVSQVNKDKRTYFLAKILLVALPILLGLNFTAILIIIAQLFLIKKLQALAKLVGGLSGDFLGASIELSQLTFLFVSLIT
ncbi:MAG: adenosylcobinamide-GDP ribazoletransferase [Desulfovibrionaceae bacterium]|nr:adenosylcobinamide-GDP ribazoletransferase [Desulfovibrionaceae bacterium]